jgi:ubiquinone/menaquinone biosynthesis C-methylase UbiE
MQTALERIPEPEVMDEREEVKAYRETDFSDVNRAFALRALRLAGPRGRAIDLGTGPAEIPIIFCTLAPGWRVLAVDASREMLREARSWIRAAGVSDRVRLLLADAKRIRGVRGGFDLVMSNSLLHHLLDPIPFWREVARLAGRRGAVLIRDLARPEGRARARALVRLYSRGASPLLKKLFYQSFLAAFTPGEVRSQLRRAGLGGLRVRMASDRHLEVSGRIRSGGGKIPASL